MKATISNLNNQIIELTRGDTFQETLFIYEEMSIDSTRYILTSNDTVYMAILEPNQKFENALIKKVYTEKDLNEDGDIIIKINSEDTEFLLPGTYYYQLKLRQKSDNNDDIITTIVPRRKLYLVE